MIKAAIVVLTLNFAIFMATIQKAVNSLM